MTIRTCRSIIEGKETLSCAATLSVAEAASLMREHRTGAIIIVAEDGRLAGIFTERDALFRVLAAERDPSATRMSEVMTPQPQTLTADEPFLRALRVMHEGRFRHLPVVEQGRPIGIVSVRDALDEDLAELRFDLEQREEARE